MNFVPLWGIVIYTISSNQSSYIHNHIKASSWNFTIIDENNCGVLSNAVPWVVMYTILQSHREMKFQKLLKNDPETWFYPAGFLTSRIWFDRQWYIHRWQRVSQQLICTDLCWRTMYMFEKCWFMTPWTSCLPGNSLKAYSLMLNRGRSENFQNWNFLHIFVALL